MATNTLPEPPAGIDLAQDQRSLIIAVSATTWAIAFVAVTARIAGRVMRGVKLWYDDWFILAALPPALAHVLSVAGYGVSRGLGQHVWAAEPDGMYAASLALFISEICYTLTMAFVKLSILAFYWRSFSVHLWIKWSTVVLGISVLMWAVAVLIVTFHQCLPSRAVWDRLGSRVQSDTGDGYSCRVDAVKFFYGNAIPTIVTDLAMLALPVPCIVRLHLPKFQRFFLGCVILLGAFVTTASAIRLFCLLSINFKDVDMTWNLVQVAVWTIVEGNLAITCASLPFLKPVLSKITGAARTFTSTSLKNLRSSKNSGPESRQSDSLQTWGVDKDLGSSTVHVKSLNRDRRDTEERPFAHVDDDASEIVSTRRADTESIELEYVCASPPPNGILVTKKVHLQHQTRP